jgi:hypothetical protein
MKVLLVASTTILLLVLTSDLAVFAASSARHHSSILLVLGIAVIGVGVLLRALAGRAFRWLALVVSACALLMAVASQFVDFVEVLRATREYAQVQILKMQAERHIRSTGTCPSASEILRPSFPVVSVRRENRCLVYSFGPDGIDGGGVKLLDHRSLKYLRRDMPWRLAPANSR